VTRAGLIITPFAPLTPNRSVTGVFKRLRIFSSAVHRSCGQVRLLGIVPEQEVAAHPDLRPVQEALAAEWGFPVEVALCPSRQRGQTAWNHYGPGTLSIGEQPEFYHYAGRPQVEAVRRELAAGPDLVFAHRLSAMIPVLRSGLRPANLFFDLDDLEHKVRLRSSLLPPLSPGKLARLAHLPALVLAEARAVALSRAAFVCSEADRRDLARLVPSLRERIRVVPNAVDIPSPREGPLPAPTVLFLGDLRYAPNRTGAERLIRKIWPRVMARRPDARLIIAGPWPEGLASFAAAPVGVEFTGFVEDLPALYRRARIVACPLDTGGGTRIKLIEAAAYCRPIVSTTIGAENLGLNDGEDLLLRDTDEAFAEGVDMLLGDPGFGERLARSAHGKVARTYSRECVEDGLATLFTHALSHPGSAQPPRPAQAISVPQE